MPRTRKAKDTSIASDLAPEPALAQDKAVPFSKIAQVTSMLRRSEGATLAEMVATTGWLPHTTRAALTGLRKKGYKLDKHGREGVTVYSIAKAA